MDIIVVVKAEHVDEGWGDLNRNDVFREPNYHDILPWVAERQSQLSCASGIRKVAALLQQYLAEYLC
jgi:hypothetical protein